MSKKFRPVSLDAFWPVVKLSSICNAVDGTNLARVVPLLSKSKCLQNESEIDFGLLTISKIDQKFSYKGSARSLVFPHGNEAVLSAIRRRFSFSELNGSLTSPQMKW